MPCCSSRDKHSTHCGVMGTLSPISSKLLRKSSDVWAEPRESMKFLSSCDLFNDLKRPSGENSFRFLMLLFLCGHVFCFCSEHVTFCLHLQLSLPPCTSSALVPPLVCYWARGSGRLRCCHREGRAPLSSEWLMQQPLPWRAEKMFQVDAWKGSLGSVCRVGGWWWRW